MAIVILGGLVTTALVSLFVLPALYLSFGGRQSTLSPEEELMHRWAGITPEPAAATAGDGARVAAEASSVREEAAPSGAKTDEAGGESGERQSAV